MPASSRRGSGPLFLTIATQKKRKLSLRALLAQRPKLAPCPLLIDPSAGTEMAAQCLGNGGCRDSEPFADNAQRHFGVGQEVEKLRNVAELSDSASFDHCLNERNVFVSDLAARLAYFDRQRSAEF